MSTRLNQTKTTPVCGPVDIHYSHSVDWPRELVLSAPKTMDEASSYCTCDCQSFHETWQFLRLFNVFSTISEDACFFANQVRETIKNGGRNILIAGAADFGILATVYQGIKLASVDPDSIHIYVVDCCQTPLRCNERFAKRKGLQLSTMKSDFTECDLGPKFDLVLSHNVLCFQSTYEKKIEFLNTIARAMSKDARYVAVERIDPMRSGGQNRFSASDEAALLLKVNSNWNNSEYKTLIPLEKLIESALGFARTSGLYFFPTDNSLRVSLQNAGLQLNTCVMNARTKDPTKSSTERVLARFIAKRAP